MHIALLTSSRLRSAHVRVVRHLLVLTLAACTLGMTACTTSTTVTTTPMGQADPIPNTPGAQERRRAAMIRLDLAINYLEVGNVSVAMEEVTNALAFDPSLTDAYAVRGMIYAQQRNFPAAEADYNRVLGLRPADADVMHNLGFLKCQESNFVLAQSWFNKALSTPGYASRGRTLMAQGLCFRQEGKPNEAMSALTSSYELDPNNPVVGYNLAVLLYDHGDVAKAQFYLRRLNQSEWRNAQTLWLGIKVENAMGNASTVQDLGSVLRNQFPQSREYLLFERKAFYE